jgi:hypothetical protein
MREGDTGVLIRVSMGENISDATSITLNLRSPNNTRKALDAALQAGTNDVVEYTTIAGDFDMAGTWLAQVHVVQPSGTRSGTVFEIDVGSVL